MSGDFRPLVVAVLCILLSVVVAAPALAQADVAEEKIVAHAVNKPLPSLKAAAAATIAQGARPGPPREVVNFRGEPEFSTENTSGADPLLQDSTSISAATSVSTGFFGLPRACFDEAIRSSGVCPPGAAPCSVGPCRRGWAEAMRTPHPHREGRP